MKGGALATVEKQGVQTSFVQSSRRESRRFSGQSAFSTPGTSFRGTPISAQLVLCF